MNSQEAFAKQKETIERYKQNDSALVERAAARPEEEVFSEIGIASVRPNRLEGYLRFFPQDFIVEEVLETGEIMRVNDFGDGVSVEGKTLYAHLIKVGIPTNVALQRIVETFGIPENEIGYSGLKDADALTSQLIAFPKTRISPAEFQAAKIDSLFFTGLRYGPGSLHPGSLKGNEFTITIRTNGAIDRDDFIEAVDEVCERGFLNYYQAQRFGGGRLISHKLGLLLARGDFETTIRYFLFKKGDYDIPLAADIRKKAEGLYPNWGEMEKLFEELPYSFYNELRLIGFLKNDPKNFVGGLTIIKDQTTLWVYAYASWLFNKRLSEIAQAGGQDNGELPLLLSYSPQIMAIYGKYLEADGTKDFKKNLLPFKFIRMADRAVKTRLLAEVHKYKFLPFGAVMNFFLPKGAYATTFLSNFFRLNDNFPIPEWVVPDEIDPKKVLGQGSLDGVKERLAANWYSKLNQGQS